MSDEATHEATFEMHRQQLVAVAYRMTGSVADAEDVVQEAYLRWQGVDPASVQSPRAFLSQVVSRLCLDVLKSARARREAYVGPWLPEPVLGEGAMAVDDATELAQDITMALMMALERLSPSERVAFLLHDVFDASYADVAAALDRSEAACRQLVSRARAHLQSERPRYTPSRDESERVVRAFGAAVLTGDIDALRAVLAENAVLYPDGGGQVVSAVRPILGRDRVARFLLGVTKKFPLGESAKFSEETVNGVPGFYIEEEGRPLQTMAFDIRDGRIASVYVVRNPEKLARLASPM